MRLLTLSTTAALLSTLSQAAATFTDAELIALKNRLDAINGKQAV